MVNPEIAHAELRRLLDANTEWLLIRANGASFALQASEIELEKAGDKLLLGFLDGRGFQMWRIVGWKREKEKIAFDLAGSFGKEKAKIEFVPRVSANEFSAAVECARLEKARRLASLIVENEPRAKLVRAQLNTENGRFAQIIFENQSGAQVAVLADVSESLAPEILLTTAILWLEKLRRRRRKPIGELWLAANAKTASDLQKMHVLLGENWRARISLKEIADDASESGNGKLSAVARLEFADLWRKKASKAPPAQDNQAGETARRIIELATAEIDASSSKNGVTLSFRGLPFARVRKMLSEEKVWFGVENRQLLSAHNFGEFAKLVDELKKHRRFDAANRRHFFYQTAPEAWLESLLRRNIKTLDANLILAPLRNQFRTERDRIDLLAMRRDGRLVIIETKTAPDRAAVFQTADYWRKVETARRAGNLQRMRVFGDLEIKNEPALVYVVAPLLAYHRDFDFLAQTVAPEIEIYRFDANENWRENLKIVRREKVSREQTRR